MRIRILGPLEVDVDGEAVVFGGGRLRTLLIQLALDAGRPIGAGALAAALWPDPEAAPSDPAHALQTLVTRLRRALPDGSVVRSPAGGGYLLALAPSSVDALEFERLIAAGRRAAANPDLHPGTAAELLAEGLALWRGDPLPEAGSAPFAEAVLARLRELRLAATEDLLAIRLADSVDERPSAAELRGLAAAHPLRERVRLLLMRALLGEGRQAEALEEYALFASVLAEELGVDPGPDLQALHLAMLRGEASVHGVRVGGTAKGRRPSPHGNLRAALTSFVGRDAELAVLAEQLGARRLVTLIGPGGVGKTRLAAKLAETVAERFAGGAWWVELAPVAEPGDIAAAVAGSLGLRDEPFVEAFSGLEALVVLDNCEHVAGAAARWAEAALVACPRLRVVATSREPLDITGEALCHVAPLPLPTALYDDAVVLFADRAAAVRPGFAATPETLGPITEICRRLDGLPLAIELAAARTRSLPVEDLAIRLADRLDLLSGGRGSEPRHRTLRAVVAWTWDLLEGEERRVAQRAAVFPAAFSLEAAERVCVPADDVLKTISALVDKSVLQLIEGAAPRYRMLETIRAYALEQLTAVDEARRTRAAHTAYFRDLAEAAEPALRTGAQLPWIRVLTAERDNLRAAFESALADGDLETALRLAGSLSLWWSIQGEHGEAVRHMRRVLDHGPVQAGPHLDRAVGGYLLNAVLSGQNVTLSPENAVETAPASSPLAVLIEPLAALMSDDVGAGLAAVDRRLPQHVRLEDAWARAMLWLVRAMLNGNGGDPRALRRDLRSAVPEFRQAGERAGLAFALLALADAEASGSGWAASVSLLEESVALLEEVDRAGGHRGGAVLQRLWLAAARAGTGDTDAARVELTELVERGIEGPAARHLMLAHVLLGDLARRDGALEAADAHYRGAQSGADRLAPLPQQSALMEAGRAQLAVARGYTGQARAHLRAAWRHLAAAVPDLPISAGLAVAAAELQLAESAPEDAAELLGAAQALGGPAAPIVPDLERVTGLVRAELSEAAYRSAYERGLARDRQGALEFFRIRLATTPAEGWRSSAEA